MKWENLKTSEEFIWISILIITLVTMIVGLIDESKFPEFSANNARYIYSAIFQGFAAILAITITAVMVTLQGLGNHIQNLENRIFRIIGKSLKEIHPIKLTDYKLYIDIQFKKDLEDNLLKNDDDDALKKIGINGLVSELQGYVDYVKEVTGHEKILKGHFFPALIIIIIIMVYSLTSLMIFVPDNQLEKIENSNRILYWGYVFTVYGICALAYFFVIILKTWQIRFKQGRMF